MDYGGDVLPRECWGRLMSGTSSALIDVRTRAEWNFVGVPMLEAASSPVILQEWQVFPEMNVDQNFASSLKASLSEAGLGEDAELFFLCRSGVRSLAAARVMTAGGFGRCFNVTGGFEGDLDADGHRGKVNGWKAEELPWKQS